MSLKNIRTAISTALQGVSGLNYSPTVPSVTNPPMAFAALRPDNPVDFDFTAGNHSLIYHFFIEVILPRAKNLEDQQDDLDTWMQPSGTTSIKAAIEAVNWGNDADACRITGVLNYGPATYGGTEYLAARFGLDIWVSN